MSALDLSALSFDDLIAREWLMASGNGGYASSTVIGLNTRKYHGLLVSADRPPFGRMVILSRVEESVTSPGQSRALATAEYPGAVHPAGHELIRAFDALPHPRWAFQADGWTIQKSIRFAPGSPGTIVISYALLGGGDGVELSIKPLFALRGIHELMYQWSGRLQAEPSSDRHDTVRIPPTSRTPAVYLTHDGQFVGGAHWYLSTLYRRERERGYAGMEDLWMPGEIRYALFPGKPVHLAVSTSTVDLPQIINEIDREDQSTRRAPAASRDGSEEVTRELSAAAEKFFAWSAPNAEQPWTCLVPQYPWTAWSVRDMLIALPGILLCQNRFAAARTLLVQLASLIRDGIVPSELSESCQQPVYNACDVSLWFIHAAAQYIQRSRDEQFAQQMLSAMRHIIESYQNGTRLGIGVNGDGLLRTREPAIATTWMNAKVGEWVITPRQGRPVELNALWYNAMQTVAGLLRSGGHVTDAEKLETGAAAHRRAFNQRFWNETAQCCYDVVHDAGCDDSIRPNQLLAISLPHAVLLEDRFDRVLAVVRKRLLTPMGLRTLSPEDASYQGHYRGDVVERDRAYHQGSAYCWLLGPYASALVKARGPTEATVDEIRRVLAGCLKFLRGEGMGTLPELFDGDAPHHPGGAVADARSVGEIARVWSDLVVAVPDSRLPNAARTPQLA